MLFRIVALLYVVTTLTGCRLVLIMFDGGGVDSASGDRDCSSNSICNIAVLDTDFYEEFTAKPKPGWEFVKWREGNGYQCAGSTDPLCIVSNRSTAGVDIAESIVASNQMFYLSPEFRPVSGATKDVIKVGNALIAQPDLFVGVSQSEMSGVCGTGICTNYLNGVDLRGWTWASLDEMNGLFSLYIGEIGAMGPGPDAYSEAPYSGELTEAFLSDWRTTATDFQGTDSCGNVHYAYIVAGRVRDSSTDAAFYTIPDDCSSPVAWFATDTDFESYSPGGWFILYQ